MPKTHFTPRDELICGKIDKAVEVARALHSVELVELLADIQHDAERMEQKLISRKEEATLAPAVVGPVSGAVPADRKEIIEWFFRWIARGKAGFAGMGYEQCADMIWHSPENPYRDNNPWDDKAAAPRPVASGETANTERKNASDYWARHNAPEPEKAQGDDCRCLHCEHGFGCENNKFPETDGVDAPIDLQALKKERVGFTKSYVQSKGSASQDILAGIKIGWEACLENLTHNLTERREPPAVLSGYCPNSGKPCKCSQTNNCATQEPFDWENEIHERMDRAFSLGKNHDDGMQIDDTQIGVEFAVKQFKELISQGRISGVSKEREE